MCSISLALRVIVVLAAMTTLVRAADDPPSPAPAPESILFEALPVVEAAALHIQMLQEAPASITILSRDDIVKYRWRTFGEALSAVRGFYLTYDRAYHYAGLRQATTPPARVPILALTAHAFGGDRERCLAAGMDGYVTKPVNAADLFRAIQQLLGQPIHLRT